MNNNSKNKDINHLATKMAVVNDTINNDLIFISNMLNAMELDVLYIISINIDDSLEYEIMELEHQSNVKYINVGLRFFVDNFLQNSEYHNFWQFNKNTLYILRGGSYSDIKELFTIIQDTKVSLVRGSSQKSHMVSPVDFRLSCYLLILCKMNYKKFHSKNSFNILGKERYLPGNRH